MRASSRLAQLKKLEAPERRQIMQVKRRAKSAA